MSVYIFITRFYTLSLARPTTLTAATDAANGVLTSFYPSEIHNKEHAFYIGLIKYILRQLIMIDSTR